MCCESGLVAVNVSGVASRRPAVYDFSKLIQAPRITSVTPMHGGTAGGDLITIEGAFFAGDATVLFVERGDPGASVSLVSGQECNWKTAGTSDVSCNETVVRQEPLTCGCVWPQLSRFCAL